MRLFPRATLAYDYLPRPSLRRSWPKVAFSIGIKRTLTGVSFEGAEERMRARGSLLSRLTPEDFEAIREYDGPWVLGRGAPLRNDLPHDR